ncbi:MAG: transposase [Gammaproteobacteria bacterium]|nr:transposase [Gammaproteobacteria bacterium]
MGNAHCHLLFLPRYSPDFNPIEKFWANLKNKIKNVITNFNSLAEAVDYAFLSIIYKSNDYIRSYELTEI